jgi:Tfp pilus assembly protein PilN
MHAVSDARIKTNVKALSSLLDQLMQLRPVTYMMKDAVEGQGRSIGFLAQQVQSLFPLLVANHMDDQNDLLGLNYYGFNVLAIKGIQEEQVQLDDLEKDLIDFDQRMKKIEQQLFSRKN